MQSYNYPKHTTRIIPPTKITQIALFYQVKSCFVFVCGDLLTHCPVKLDGGDINVAVRCETTQIHKVKEVTVVTSRPGD